MVFSHDWIFPLYIEMFKNAMCKVQKYRKKMSGIRLEVVALQVLLVVLVEIVLIVSLVCFLNHLVCLWAYMWSCLYLAGF